MSTTFIPSLTCVRGRLNQHVNGKLALWNFCVDITFWFDVDGGTVLEGGSVDSGNVSEIVVKSADSPRTISKTAQAQNIYTDVGSAVDGYVSMEGWLLLLIERLELDDLHDVIGEGTVNDGFNDRRELNLGPHWSWGKFETSRAFIHVEIPCASLADLAGEMTIPMTRIAADDGTVTVTPKDGIDMTMSDQGKENRIGGQEILIESTDRKERETRIIRMDMVNVTDSRRSASPRRRRSGSRSRSASPPKAKPNFGASGLLAAETNTVKSIDGKNSTVLKYNEPPEARKPVLGWRLYVFKGSEQVELLHIQRQSAYLFGRDRLVADIPIDHPSCSKQHAAIQYRYIQEKNEFGDVKGSVKYVGDRVHGSRRIHSSFRPFIIDLESTNGTHVNDEVVPPSRYYELRASDVIKFGLSTKEYVLLHDEVAS
ncbi:hypothetical protein DFS33DRAFT_1455670 [Desarmillaria ectypa]|nr:hypothetical protein DFS33DRAFT_1455670 [Desarmillaria ectypa]